MKISMLASNMSSNNLLFITSLAKVLERHYDVEIIGPTFGNDVYNPCKNLPINYKIVEGATFPQFARSLRQMVNKIEGDVIYAFDHHLASYGVAILAKIIKRVPVILDKRDWTTKGYVPQTITKRIYSRLCEIRSVRSPHSNLYNRFTERLTGLADEITVSSRLLKSEFGGTILPQGADCSAFNPKNYTNKKVKQKWGIQDEKVVMFTGNARPHKGLEELIEAIKMVNVDSLRLMIVGNETNYVKKLKESGRDIVCCVGSYPHNKIPEFLSLADLVVLPQRDCPYAQAQVPMKVYEAMAMAKPIIATDVSDLPEILDGCGWIVEPEKPNQLAEKIQYVLDHPAEAKEKGKKAREKCKANYSYEAMEKILLSIFEQYE